MNARLFALPLLAALVVSQAPAVAQVVDRDFPLGGAGMLRLNVSGHVHILTDGPRGTVKVHVVDYGPSLPALKFNGIRSGARFTLTISGPTQSVLPFVGASGYETDVHVPSNVRIDLREFGGRVRVDNVTAPAQYYDANGSIEVADSRAALTAEADNGNIIVGAAHANVMLTIGNGTSHATLARDWSGNLIRMEASNGAMTLLVPQNFHGNFDVTAANGKVSNPLRSMGKTPVVFLLSQSGDITVATAPSTP
jgi:hypothetical protein